MELLSEFLRIFLKEIGRMWWFTLLGITLAALIKTYQLDRIVRQYVGKYGILSIFIATAVGCLSPLCSCGILPVVIPMALSGVPLPPLFALLATSPTMDPTSFFLTMGALGPELAWWKFGGAVFLGLFFGFTAYFFSKAGFFSGNNVRLKPVLNEKGELASAYEIGLANGILLRTMVVVPRASKFRFFLDRFRDVGVFVAFWVVAAVAIEAAIHVLVPISAVTWLVGQKGVFSVVASALVGIPLPLHQIPAIPVLAGLKAKGMADGADIAFLMAGPVTSI
ncbi:hypothetical protein FDZ71_09985, partial [bacterium]